MYAGLCVLDNPAVGLNDDIKKHLSYLGSIWTNATGRI